MIIETEIGNFEFIKIGTATRNKPPLKAKNISDDYRLFLELIDNKFLEAGQSVYLILDEQDIIYVGYYSTSFKDRWWKKDGYFWHGDIVDNKIDKLVKKGRNITVWLSIDPYIRNNDGQFNISKLLEDTLIMKYAKEYKNKDNNKKLINTTGKNLEKQQSETKSVIEILNIK